MLRIAFPLIGGGDWTGGRNYLLNLVRALALHCSEQVTPVLFHGTEVLSEEIAPFAELPGVESVCSAAFDRGRRQRSLANALIVGSDRSLRRLFAQHGVDVIFEAAQFFGARIGLPAIAWLPDFQHRHLPHLFSQLARIKRELGFRAQIAAGRVVMLSSHDARLDCERFYPATRHRALAVHFAVPPPAPMDAQAAKEIADSYGLAGEFFYLPNQFWVHKNHLLVVDALAKLRAQGRRVVVAASGNTRDPRAPQHFSRLCERVQALGLEHEFRMLGMIPYAHLGALMQECAALLNPSLFEGWSTTVAEAQSLGVPLILSDLAVHREQAGEDGATYFNRSSPDALAQALASFQPISPEERRLRCLRSGVEAQARIRLFAEEFVAVAKLAADRART